jgi:hypothetical protein
VIERKEEEVPEVQKSAEKRLWQQQSGIELMGPFEALFGTQGKQGEPDDSGRTHGRLPECTVLVKENL